MKIRRHLSYANVAATIALFLALGGTAYAATGGNFILGASNSAGATTRLTSTHNGAALNLTPKSGFAPLSTNSGKKVTNLNADRIDGFDSSNLMKHGTIRTGHGPVQFMPHTLSGPTTFQHYTDTLVASGDGFIAMSLVGPDAFGATNYALKSVRYCFSLFAASPIVNAAIVYKNVGNGSVLIVNDLTDRTTNGCYTVTVNDAAGGDAYTFSLNLSNGGSARLDGVQATWAKQSTIPALSGGRRTAAPGPGALR